MNQYKIDGEVTYLYLVCKGEVKECLIDTEDLPKIQAEGIKFHGNWSELVKSFYVLSNGKTVNGKRKKVALHRLIMSADAKKVVDHINHNTLDNRKCNLRIVTHAQNQQNLNGLKANNTTGYRGVSINQGKYRAVVRINGKTKHIGYFDNAHDAGKAAKEARLVYLPFSEEGVG